MTAAELRERLGRLNLTRAAAAARLGLSEPALYHNLNGRRPVGRQTEIILSYIERELARKPTKAARER